MRNKLGFLALLLLISTVSFGQVRFAIGPKVGLNFGSLSSTPEFPGGQSGRTAMMFGAAVELMFSNMFGVQVEPGYAMKGASFQPTNAAGQPVNGTTGTWAINEIQFPILFKAKFLDGPVKLYSFLGPNLGIVASSVIKITVPNGTEPDRDQSQFTSGMDFGMDIGSGLQYMIGKKVSVTFDTRYSFGLSNLSTTPAGQQQQTANSDKSRGFQILFGALFQI